MVGQFLVTVPMPNTGGGSSAWQSNLLLSVYTTKVI